MVGSHLTVKDRRRRELAPRILFVRAGRFADVLTVRLPAGITAERFADRLPEITEATRDALFILERLAPMTIEELRTAGEELVALLTADAPAARVESRLIAGPGAG